MHFTFKTGAVAMWPFKKKQVAPPADAKTKSPIDRIGRYMIQIDELNFFGSFSKSPNKKFLISWGPSNTVILVKNDKILFSKKLQVLRLDDGKVADNGTFIVTDIRGNELESMFFIFDMLGQQLLCHKFHANTLNTAISADGKYAACQLANNPDHKDGGALAMFDIEHGALLWQRQPYVGTNTYNFDTKERTLHTGTFTYSATGEALDLEGSVLFLIGKSHLSYLLHLTKKLLQGNWLPLTSEAANLIIKKLQLHIDNQITEDSKEEALTHRRIGEMYEFNNEKDKAISYYEQALVIDDAVGVKIKLRGLKKALPQSPK